MTQKNKNCKDCGKLIWDRSERCPSCRTKFLWKSGVMANRKVSPRPNLRGDKHPHWKGGRVIGRDGYVQVLVAPKTYRMEHRIVWEATYGKIPDGYEIHHLNGIRSDNRLENLTMIHRTKHLTQRDTLIQVLRKRIRKLEEKLCAKQEDF